MLGAHFPGQGKSWAPGGGNLRPWVGGGELGLWGRRSESMGRRPESLSGELGPCGGDLSLWWGGAGPLGGET